MPSKNRKTLPNSVRFEVFKRDGFACKYCGRKPPECALQVDHVLALNNGGTDLPTNLLTACVDCNSGKSDGLLTEIMEQKKDPLEKLATTGAVALCQLLKDYEVQYGR